MSNLSKYPSVAKESLRDFIGQDIADLPTPAAIVDVAKLRYNCTQMLKALEQFDLSFRAHVKTHKTLEGVILQLGEHCNDVRLVCSTVIEAEHLVPLLRDYQCKGASVNLLYGVPISHSHVPRLASVARELGEGSLTLMVDHPDQLASVKSFKEATQFPARLFIKADSGYHRAGVAPESAQMAQMVKLVSALEESGDAELLGFYSHNSLSYGGSKPDEAMDMLKVELDVCKEAANHLKSQRSSRPIISVGASPTALSIQNLSYNLHGTTSKAGSALQDTLAYAKARFEVEIHAGVYPFLDIQQVAANSRHFDSDPHSAIAVSVLTEICSLYPDRTRRPEALVSCGVLALAREPCKDYSGWGVVTPWGMSPDYSTLPEDRIVVSRISQEHGILAYQNKDKEIPLPLRYAQKLRIWPNHACITLSMYGWYFIVDSDSATPDKIVDIWVRWRGW